ncbi:uncharacterized protein MONBRDRAFT_27923 [Monosiga brevicollis MX1]|uniref:TIR domain-containing protein n=1 Tax=Monosiga brevicollis TaxID=81824 RepID=A9V6F2_MONBE|nr:uncharacterized protein MONBRDRAFT_27923 [Monosiga brevicollis MX1]EDQ86872.1 predicted protein [Monosiga brevicollis MX1]|eukprot:XP_001748417.1 hypothetical protein [Monosiga brevicollis MX1]
MGNACITQSHTASMIPVEQHEAVLKEYRDRIATLERALKDKENELDRTQQQLAQTTRERDELQAQVTGLKQASPTKQLSPRKNTKATAVQKRVPQVGDKVIAHWIGWQFYPARVAAFDPRSLKYTVNWDDGDTSHREQHLEHVALDLMPEQDEVGVGTAILFPQGRYRAEVDREAGEHWHLGEITAVHQLPDGTTRYDGKHLKGEADGKRRHHENFENYPLDRLRLPPNVFMAVDDAMEDDDDDGEEVRICDVFFMFHAKNASTRIQNPDALPNYADANAMTSDPRQIRSDIEAAGLSCWVPEEHPGVSIAHMTRALRGAKVVVACVSNEFAMDKDTRNLFQFAKKTARKPCIPITTVVGFLISGELYINFQDVALYNSKRNELVAAVRTALADPNQSNAIVANNPRAAPDDAPTDVFISYCWNNSCQAQRVDGVSNVVGTEYNDPRRIKSFLEQNGFKVWIDVDRLESGGAGLFEELALGLQNTKLVVAFVSDEYAMSENCRTEFQFACKSLKKPIVPIVVGQGDKWQMTVVGLLIAGMSHVEPLQLRNLVEANHQGAWNSILAQVKKHVAADKVGARVSSVDFGSSTLIQVDEFVLPVCARVYFVNKASLGASPPAPVMDLDVIQPGDKVISHWVRWQFYPAKVISVNRETRKYEIQWDDGDVTGRDQPFGLVAKDITPAADEIGVGSQVFFPQGRYKGNDDYNRSSGIHWHLGQVDKIDKGEGGELLFSGFHLKGEADQKWVTFSGYAPRFENLPASELRVSPNMISMLMA